MSDISKIDKNFEVKATIEKDGMRFYNCLSEPFVVNGLMNDGEKFYRLSIDIADNVSERVKILNYHTAGGRARFRTDSKNIAILVKYNGAWKMPHCAFCGSIGFHEGRENCE